MYVRKQLDNTGSGDDLVAIQHQVISWFDKSLVWKWPLGKVQWNMKQYMKKLFH